MCRGGGGQPSTAVVTLPLPGQLVHVNGVATWESGTCRQTQRDPHPVSPEAGQQGWELASSWDRGPSPAAVPTPTPSLVSERPRHAKGRRQTPTCPLPRSSRPGKRETSCPPAPRGTAWEVCAPARATLWSRMTTGLRSVNGLTTNGAKTVSVFWFGDHEYETTIRN